MLIELNETGPGINLPLTPGQGRSLADSGVVTARPSPHRPGYWLVRSATRVGAAQVGDAEVHIRPKIRVGRLLFLAGYAQHGVAWLEQDVHVREAEGLIPIVAQILWRQVERAIHQGLLPGYVTVEEGSPMLRGRLREAEQLRRHHGMPLPLEVRYDEFTVDTVENRILRTAAERMLTVPGVDPQAQHMLRRLMRAFADVTLLPLGGPIPAWEPTRPNLRYHSALRIAELVLRASSVEHGQGVVAVNGFLLNVPKLFEDFVTAALRDTLTTSYGGRVDAQAEHKLDEAGRVTLRPDIIWLRDGSVAAVVDAKYKAERPAGYPNADLYQLLAYCTALGLRTGHLVYAKGNEQPARHVVRKSGVEIICHAIDLDQEPEQLLSQVELLATSIAQVSSTESPLSQAAPTMAI